MISEWIGAYGDVFGYFVGWMAVLVVADVHLVKQVGTHTAKGPQAQRCKPIK